MSETTQSGTRTLFDPERARRRMEARGIDVLVGAGYVNYGYIAGYSTHSGRDCHAALS